MLNGRATVSLHIPFCDCRKLISAISYEGIDWKGFPWFDVPEGGFGPGPGEFEWAGDSSDKSREGAWVSVALLSFMSFNIILY